MFNLLKKARITFSQRPDVLKLKVQNKLRHYASNPQAAESVSQTLENIAAQLKALELTSAGVYGDENFKTQMLAAAPQIDWVWGSNRSQDLTAGAQLPQLLVDAKLPALVVGGENIATAYVDLLRRVSKESYLPHIFWIAEKFEYCFSTLPVPEGVTETDCYLFNHFQDFFQVKDPLLVRFSVEDHASSYEFFKIVSPRETVKFSLQDIIPERKGPAMLRAFCAHPTLTRGRHHRWRVCADVFWQGSFTTLHGAHDHGPSRTTQSRVSVLSQEPARVVVTLPNYEGNLGSEEMSVFYDDKVNKNVFTRSNEQRIDQIAMKIKGSAGPAEEPARLSYVYNGYGTSFWYAMVEANAPAGRPAMLYGNHEAGISLVETTAPLSEQVQVALDKIESQGFVIYPHPLPITAPHEDIEFGFDFGDANPKVNDFICYFYNAQGSLLHQGIYTQRGLQNSVFAGQLLEGFPELDREKAVLVLVAPAWKKMQMDPHKMNCVGNLLARSRGSGDMDATEFQSCWRNLGVNVEGFPHWIMPNNAILSRTNLVGRIADPQRFSSGLVLVNGSGNLKYQVNATVEIVVVNPAGKVLSYELELRPFAWQCVWLKEIFPKLEEFLAEGFGSFMVKSLDADINGQLLTVGSKGGVSLQHLWGY